MIGPAMLCPVRGCGAQRQHGYLMCKRCWLSLTPPRLRRAVNGAWLDFRTASREDFGFYRKTYEAARDAAIEAAAAGLKRMAGNEAP